MDEQGAGDPRAPIGRGERTALLVVDMLNDYEHPDGEVLRENARRTLRPIAGLVRAAEGTDVPVIHVNDIHGRWDAGRDELTELARAGLPDEDLDAVLPGPGAPLVVKARHSVFYGSPLEYLLETEGIGRIVMTGQVTEQCILYSALDAYIRHFKVVVPSDAVAAIDEELAVAALRMMEANMRAQVLPAAEVDLGG